MPDPSTPAEQAPPDQPTQAWPEAFTDADILVLQTMSTALAGVVAQSTAAITQIAAAHWQATHDAILIARGGARIH